MKKLLGLDLGDAWVGVAISDFLKIVAKPLKSYATSSFDEALLQLLSQESIETIVVGLPVTVGGGTDSDQTKKIRLEAKRLGSLVAERGFSQIQWVLWDERLSSKRAAALSKGPQSKEEKLMQHAKAAAFVLQNYLDHLSFIAS
ncbi:Holliday junction resolvase RuvX [Candidatus Dependentiae bacterium]|nr:Holliday junction resolvase RuvX [Candidatus Dependentiae bacterium]